MGLHQHKRYNACNLDITEERLQQKDGNGFLWWKIFKNCYVRPVGCKWAVEVQRWSYGCTIWAVSCQEVVAAIWHPHGLCIRPIPEKMTTKIVANSKNLDLNVRWEDRWLRNPTIDPKSMSTSRDLPPTSNFFVVFFWACRAKCSAVRSKLPSTKHHRN